MIEEQDRRMPMIEEQEHVLRVGYCSSSGAARIPRSFNNLLDVTYSRDHIHVG